MVSFIESQTTAYGGNDKAAELAAADFCQIVFCLNEFIFID